MIKCHNPLGLLLSRVLKYSVKLCFVCQPNRLDLLYIKTSKSNSNAIDSKVDDAEFGIVLNIVVHQFHGQRPISYAVSYLHQASHWSTAILQDQWETAKFTLPLPLRFHSKRPAV